MRNRLFSKIFWSFWLNFLLQLFLMWLLVTVVLPVDPRIMDLAAKQAAPQELELASRLVRLGGPTALPPESVTFPIRVSVDTVTAENIDRSRVVIGPDGKRYLVSIQLPPSRKADGRVPPSIYVIGLISGLISAALLAFYLVKPIRWLKAGFENFAAGNLSIRLTPHVGSRRDEIADLARDFDGMADKIELLVRMRDQLLDDVSHELRSPLARLQLAIALARQNSDRREDVLARIEREAARLDAIVNELLTLSRLESGAPILDGYFDLAALVEDVTNDARFEGMNSGVFINTSICGTGDNFYVAGDSELVRRAIENVVRNAIRFSPKPGTVTIQLEQISSVIVARVQDSGPGLPPERFETLFKPFSKGEGGGWGLGLAIAQRAVLAHGGMIDAQNVEQGGFLVSITLPLNSPIGVSG